MKSNFEKIVKEMRAAQKEYNLHPTGENLNYVEDLEDEVDEYLAFVDGCKGTSYQEVKTYLKKAAEA